MKELIINVPEDAVDFVEEFVDRIGGTVAEVDKKPVKKSMKPASSGEVKLSDFFGSWPDIDLDPKTYRKTLWGKRLDL